MSKFKELNEKMEKELSKRLETFDASKASVEEIEMMDKLYSVNAKVVEAREASTIKKVSVVTTIVTAIVNFIFMAFWLKKAMIFEETGAFTSATGKALFNSVFKKFGNAPKIDI